MTWAIELHVRHVACRDKNDKHVTLTNRWYLSLLLGQIISHLLRSNLVSANMHHHEMAKGIFGARAAQEMDATAYARTEKNGISVNLL